MDFGSRRSFSICYNNSHIETENDLFPSKVQREMSTDLWDFDLTTNALMHHFFIYYESQNKI